MDFPNASDLNMTLLNNEGMTNQEVREMVKEQIGGFSSQLFYASLGIIGFWLLFMFCEFCKITVINNENYSIDKIKRYLEIINYIQRVVLLFMFLLVALVFQITLWGM